MTAEDNDHKRSWLTCWKTKVAFIVLNIFPGFIGDGIMSKPVPRNCYMRLRLKRVYQLLTMKTAVKRMSE